MDTTQLLRVCAKDPEIRRRFLGVFACDKLPHYTTKRPVWFIANTKPSSHRGQHWIAVYIDETNHGYYFCSYGIAPNLVFQNYLTTTCCGWSRNTKRLQSSITTTCGQHCVFFLYAISRGVSVAEFYNCFSSRYNLNDAFVNEFVNDVFGENFDVFQSIQ